MEAGPLSRRRLSRRVALAWLAAAGAVRAGTAAPDGPPSPGAAPPDGLPSPGAASRGGLPSPGAAASDPPPSPGTPARVADGVEALLGSRDAADTVNAGAVGNLGLVETPAGAVVVNAGGSYRLGRAVIARAERHTGRPPALLVVTQARPEYVMGMAAFAERGIEIVAHAATARLIATRCDECLRRLRRDLGEAAMQGTRLVAPTRTVTGDTVLEPGGRRIELRHLGTAQTPGDLVVVDRATGVAFAGAMVVDGRVPELEDAGGARPWRRALAALAALPVRVLVPGYGTPGLPAALIARTDAYLAALAEEVQARWDRGGDLLGATRELDLPAWRGWAQYQPLHARNVQREFLAAEARWVQQK